jgi:hypothetical protein
MRCDQNKKKINFFNSFFVIYEKLQKIGLPLLVASGGCDYNF